MDMRANVGDTHKEFRKKGEDFQQRGEEKKSHIFERDKKRKEQKKRKATHHVSFFDDDSVCSDRNTSASVFESQSLLESSR